MAAGAASHPRRGAGEGNVYVMECCGIDGEGCGAEVRGVVGMCCRNLKPSWKKGHQRQTTCVCK